MAPRDPLPDEHPLGAPVRINDSQGRPIKQCAHCGWDYPADSPYAVAWRGKTYCCDGCLIEATRDQPCLRCVDLASAFTG